MIKNMSTLKERLQEAMEEASLNKTALWKGCGLSSGAISHWFNGSTQTLEGKNLLNAARVLNVDPNWLATGKGKKKKDNSNTSPAPSVKGEVPVISWVQAGTWNEAMDCERQEDLKYLPCISNHSECSFALRVRGDSMTAPYGKTYPEGCIIFVDPEIRMPSSGDRIIAKVNGEAEVTFKVFMKEGEKIWLKPLNSQHPIITDEFKVLGKVIGKWEDD
jgi:SOS-response transcriptional repressor LexA